jgi:hypothetical protein
MVIFAFDQNDAADSEWRGVFGERTLMNGVVADFGLGDAQIALMEFKGPKGGMSFEVGHGEACRPYDVLYSGKSREKASKVWLEAVSKYAL